MAPQKNVAIEPALLEQAGKVAAAEGKTVDELATDALKRELARRALEKFRRDAEPRRRGMTDGDVAATVEEAVHEGRKGKRLQADRSIRRGHVGEGDARTPPDGP